MKIFTIGFTKKTAEEFFQILQQNGVQCIVDIRLHPDGQLAGFSKKEDLRYFLDKLIGCKYIHMPQLAPTDEILKAYRSDHDWQKYLNKFETLMDQREIPAVSDRKLFEEKACCLLCSELTADYCHRRLVAERMQKTWSDVEIVHL